MSNNRNFNQLSTDLAGFFQVEQKLAKQLAIVAEVIRNTAQKLTVPLPNEFAWAMSPHNAYTNMRLVYINTYRNERNDISYKVASGDVRLDGDCVLVFDAKPYYNNTVKVGEVPVKYLLNDPIAVAQWVRKTARRAHAKSQNQLLETLKKNASEAAEKLEAANSALERHQTAKPLKPTTNRVQRRLEATKNVTA